MSDMECVSDNTETYNCIVCKKGNKRKKTYGSLSISTSKEKEKLREAAEIKQSSAIILNQLENHDHDTYHHAICYRQFTKCLANRVRNPKTREFQRVFNVFGKKVIQQRIIQNLEVMDMGVLTRLFKQTAKKISTAKIEYRKFYLKAKLKKNYPQLCFSRRQYKKNESVFVQDITKEKLVADLENQKDMIKNINQDLFEISSESESETESDSTTTPISLNIEEESNFQQNNKILYNAAIILKNIIANSIPPSSPWPPTSADITLKASKETIPPLFFNFLAWATSNSDQPDFEKYVNTTNDHKLISLCQDITYLTLKGRHQTPKSLALGMAVKHITGSARVINILNGLGHCVSHDVVTSHETALAQLIANDPTSIPQNIVKFQPTILVWDNNDFHEETLSGHGTTHNTNGIIIQTSNETNQSTELNSERICLKRGIKKFQSQNRLMLQNPYKNTKAKGPGPFEQLKIDKHQYNSLLQPPHLLHYSYLLTKVPENNLLLPLPNWSGFYTLLKKDENCENCEKIQKSNIGYLPVINASPTEYSTVYTLLKRSINIADTLCLENIVVVFDQAIYAKAQQIRWQDQMFRERIVIRLGEFHTVMSFMAILGKMFGDAGLQDIVTEVGIVMPGSIIPVLNGHHYNRSLRAHKIVCEALERHRFLAYLEQSPVEEKEAHLALLEELKNTFLSSPSEWKENITSHEFQNLVTSYHDFIEKNISKHPTFSFWSLYCELVELLLTFIRATREGNWGLHLAAVRSMMPWFFAFDRVNYARYLPVYWSEMVMLEETHPSAHQQILKLWTVQRQDNYPFSSIAADQAIEQTLNRDTKTKGGLKGFTLSQGAVDRWTLAQAERAAITKQCEIMAGKDQDRSKKRKDLEASVTNKFEKSIQSTMSFLTSSINPFTNSSSQLLNITTGVAATQEIAKDMSQARKVGEEQCAEFVKNKVQQSKKSVFDTLQRNKLKTFSTLRKTVKTTNKKGEALITKTDRELFARLLVIGMQRKVDVKQLLEYSLSPIPMALGNPDGSLVKNSKSVLLHELENNSQHPPDLSTIIGNINKNGALIIDAMAKLQSLRNLESTFEELASRILRDLEQSAKCYGCHRVDFVTDCYFANSIKELERKRRMESNPPLIYTIQNGKQKVPRSWANFLSSAENKMSLVQYLVNAWSCAKITPGLDIYIGYKETCTQLRVTGSVTLSENVSPLECDHEEADTRMLLHANHAAKDHDYVLVETPDTDVLAIMVSVELPKNIYMVTGKGDKRRVIDVSAIKEELGLRSKSVIGLHVFTGCDSTSAFHGKGKKTPLSLMLSDQDFTNVFSTLGEEFKLNSSAIPTLEKFVCHMYNQTSVNSVNDCRYRVFCLHPNVEKLLPPNSDCLYQHILRSNYQCAIHRRSLHQFIHAPSPEGHGWIIENNQISIKWMDKPHAPGEIINSVHCNCKTNCKSNRCSCKKNKLSCTDICKCKSCENHNERSFNESDSSDEDDE